VPSAIWVVDTKKEHIAVNEARKLGIPVIAILDTNCDPDEVNYPIPGNDDAIRSVAILTRIIADAVAEGLIARAGASGGDDKPAGAVPGAEEPLAEWERELLEGATAQAPVAGQAEDAADAAADAVHADAEAAAALQAATPAEAVDAAEAAADVEAATAETAGEPATDPAAELAPELAAEPAPEAETAPEADKAAE
jgi:small subunit ribosomal protein S2